MNMIKQSMKLSQTKQTQMENMRHLIEDNGIKICI